LYTEISDTETVPGALHSFARQGNPGFRHLVLIKVTELAARLRDTPGPNPTIEHIHDY
jgi:hypothetical protein